MDKDDFLKYLSLIIGDDAIKYNTGSLFEAMGFGDDDISANQNEQLNEMIDKIIKKGLTNENIVLDSLGNINENKKDDYDDYEEIEF